jgi:hypothetical protein
MILLNFSNSNNIKILLKFFFLAKNILLCVLSGVKLFYSVLSEVKFNFNDTSSVDILHYLEYVFFLTITKLNQGIKYTYVKILLYCFLMPAFFHKLDAITMFIPMSQFLH